ncbi:hypothetical protein [Candidatus Methylomirabilis limnetica]|uniref:hypothetical protein n=1 Tax=Candidatus Methylomirabilis limnetica TaxID=2033718 RepID=UPI001EFCC41A|nr:hypothetical protein [Candidatus Methylomirabilis limnetica]
MRRALRLCMLLAARGAGAAALFAAGIHPAKARKAGEVRVGRIRYVAALDRQRGGMIAGWRLR